MRWIGLLLALAALLAGVVRWTRDLEFRPEPLLVPLRPLATAPGLEPSDAVPAAPGSLTGRDLLLITLDTTRADRLGCYGNRAIETPNLDALAASGVVFTHAVAATAISLPSHASILTGLYPYHHGVRNNTVFRLGEAQRTLAEVVAAHGYETAAFVSSFVLDARFGLDQGFSLYDDRTRGTSVRFGFSERRADETTDRAIAWLERAHARPVFTWVHYFDPHVRYDPPEPYVRRAAQAYDGEIAFLDAQLGRLIRAAGERTLIAVVADHGEALGEHGERTHGNLVQEATLQVPLILHAGGGLPGGVRIDARVSQVDLMPTLLSLLGIAAPEGLDGVDLTSAPDPERPVVAETLGGYVDYGWAPLAALYRGPLKYVDAPEPQLYDLAQDPVERHDRAAERPREAAELQRLLRSLRGPEADRFEAQRIELSEDEIQGLRALGYLAAGAESGLSGGGSGEDPNAMVPLLGELWWLIAKREHYSRLPAWQRVLARLSGGLPHDDDALIRELEALADAHPGFTPAQRYLSELYAERGRLDDARHAHERWEQQRPGAPEAGERSPTSGRGGWDGS